MKGIVILLLVGCISHVHGLECYSCTFHKNIPNDWFNGPKPPPSDKDCEKKPKNVITCPDLLSIEESQAGSGSLLKDQFGKPHNVNTTTNGEVEISQAFKSLCKKTHLKAGNKVVVFRGCGISYGDYADVCDMVQGSHPTLGGSYEETQCVCANDKCNGGQVLQISTLLALAFFVVHGFC